MKDGVPRSGATFINGRYANQAHGNHAVLYMGQTTDGILVMDQWKNKKEKLVTSRVIRRKGKSKSGIYIQPSDNADAYFVIE